MKQLQVTNWSDYDDSPGSCDALINVLQLTQEWTHNQATSPIVVHCRYLVITGVIDCTEIATKYHYLIWSCNCMLHLRFDINAIINYNVPCRVIYTWMHVRKHTFLNDECKWMSYTYMFQIQPYFFDDLNNRCHDIVSCRDGAQKTGLCCAAMFIIDQLQAEEVVDIFHAIRRVQANRPQFILSEVTVTTTLYCKTLCC